MISKRSLLQSTLALAMAAGLSGHALAQDKPLKIGVTAGPHAQIFEQVKKVAEQQGLKIQVVEFSDYVQPNIAVDDGSKDATWDAIKSVPGVVALRAGANRGQSAAVYAGLRVAKGRFIGTMDGDGQTDPADYAAMVEALRREKVDVVIGYRATREDTWSKQYA